MLEDVKVETLGLLGMGEFERFLPYPPMQGPPLPRGFFPPWPWAIKGKAVEPGDRVGVIVRWRNAGESPIAPQFRLTIKPLVAGKTPIEGEWAQAKLTEPGEEDEATCFHYIPTGWASGTDVGARVDLLIDKAYTPAVWGTKDCQDILWTVTIGWFEGGE